MIGWTMSSARRRSCAEVGLPASRWSWSVVAFLLASCSGDGAPKADRDSANGLLDTHGKVDSQAPSDLHENGGDGVLDAISGGGEDSHDVWSEVVGEAIVDSGGTGDGGTGDGGGHDTDDVFAYDALDQLTEVLECPPDDTDLDGDGLTGHEECTLGSDPAILDSDLDGVEDGVEVDEGTDPADPSSASGWQPKLASVHPRLYFDADDLDSLRQRWTEPQGADAVLKGRIISLCNAQPPEHPQDGTFDIWVSKYRAQVAAACAFRGLMEEDSAILVRSVDILTAPSPDPSYLGIGKIVPEAEYGLHESEALVAACSAWDYLAGSGDLLDSGSKALVRSSTIARLAKYRLLMHKDAFYLFLVTSQNNHGLKAMGAMGLCAMALNDYPEAAVDMNEAIGGITYLLTKYQSVPEGGYGEGWNYLTYGAESFLPFLAAYHRFSGGTPYPYKNPSSYTDQDPLKGYLHWYEDLASNSVVKAVFEKALWSTDPRGLMVNTDDANPTPLHGAIIDWLFDDPRFLWNWHLPAVSNYSGSLPTMTFALHRHDTDPEEPDWPLDLSLPAAGFAILRTGFGAEDQMMVVEGENGTVNFAGAGHEHPDPTSFLLHAHGEYLAIDPGYINFELHDMVKRGRDHNVILVDGEGPEMKFDYLPKTEGFLGEIQSNNTSVSVVVNTGYLGITVDRTITRIDNAIYIIADSVSSEAPRSLAFQLNGFGGGEVPDSAFQLTQDGAVWNRPGASLHLWSWALADTPGLPNHRLEEHATSWGTWAMHEAFRLEATMGPEAGGFLSVMVPVAALDIVPEVESLAVGSGYGVVSIGWHGSCFLAAFVVEGASADALAHAALLVPDGQFPGQAVIEVECPAR